MGLLELLVESLLLNSDSKVHWSCLATGKVREQEGAACRYIVQPRRARRVGKRMNPELNFCVNYLYATSTEEKKHDQR